MLELCPVVGITRLFISSSASPSLPPQVQNYAILDVASAENNWQGAEISAGEKLVARSSGIEY
jgi:hypothetical protein